MDDENDLDHIFEEYENEDAEESANEPRNGENSANAESNEGQTREVVPVPKRIIRNPRLKFNAERLCGERGIPIVTKHFKNVKFKGKGHEKEDLNKLLSTLEHWSHRLFPSMKFEACLKQIEKLGKKRAVQTCLVKIRRDMPILSSDFVHDDEDDEREGETMPTEAEEPPSEDAFDRLFGETQRAVGDSSNLTSTPQNKPSTGVVLGSSFGSSLTEEQRKRIEYNKMLATERRKAKMASTLATNAESGSPSPSVLDPVFAGTSNSSSYSQTNLELQFDSLFDEPTTHENSKKSHLDSNLLTNEDYNETQELSSNINQQFESLLDKPIDHKNVNKTHLDNNQPTDEDYQMGVHDYDETLKLSSNVNQQFEGLVDKPSQKDLTSDECMKDSLENHHTCEETEMDLQDSGPVELVESNYKSSDDVFGSMREDSDKSYAAFEKKDGSMLNESSPQTSVIDPSTSVQEDTVKKLSVKTEDSVMNNDEPICNSSKIGQSQSAFVTNEIETEELGLDELMDLVDGDVV